MSSSDGNKNIGEINYSQVISDEDDGWLYIFDEEEFLSAYVGSTLYVDLEAVR